MKLEWQHPFTDKGNKEKDQVPRDGQEFRLEHLEQR